MKRREGAAGGAPPLRAASYLAALAPRDLLEHQAVDTLVQTLWREQRAGRLEAEALDARFGAALIADPAEARAARCETNPTRPRQLRRCETNPTRRPRPPTMRRPPRLKRWRTSPRHLPLYW